MSDNPYERQRFDVPASFVGTDVTFRSGGGIKTYPLRKPVTGPGVFTFSLDDEGFAIAQRIEVQLVR